MSTPQTPQGPQPRPQPSTCKGCKRVIIWGRNAATGNLIPLDAVAPVYRVTDPAGGVPTIEKQPEFYVSHFAVCTKVERFKRVKDGITGV